MSDHGPGPVGPAPEPGASPVGTPAASPSGAWAPQPTPAYASYSGQPVPPPPAGDQPTDAWPNIPYGSPAYQQGPPGAAVFPEILDEWEQREMARQGYR